MTRDYQIEIDGQIYPVTVSDEKEALLAAQAAGRAVLGVGEGCWDLRLPAAAKDWGCVSWKMAEQTARRKAGLPWTICTGDRIRIREAGRRDWEGLKQRGPFPEWPDQETFQAYLEGQYGFYEYGIWLIEEKETRLLLGRAGLWNPGETVCRRLEAAGEEKNAYLELGYEIFLPYRRRGFAKEACRLIMDYADWELESCLCLQVSPDNLPSRNLAQALGFRLLKEPAQDQLPSTYFHRGSGETRWPFLYVWSC